MADMNELHLRLHAAHLSLEDMGGALRLIESHPDPGMVTSRFLQVRAILRAAPEHSPAREILGRYACRFVTAAARPDLLRAVLADQAAEAVSWWIDPVAPGVTAEILAAAERHLALLGAGAPVEMAAAHWLVGACLCSRQEHDRAEIHFNRGLACAFQAGDAYLCACNLEGLGRTLADSAPDRAWDCLCNARRIYARINDDFNINRLDRRFRLQREPAPMNMKELGPEPPEGVELIVPDNLTG